MSKKGLTIDVNTGKKQLATFIDDTVAQGKDDIAYSGKFVDENLLSVSHDSHLLGGKVLDEANISDNYVINYDSATDKIEYTKADDLIEEIDCGYF